MRLSTLARRPALTVLVGAVAIAFSGILFRLSHVSPSTGAFYRCVWALPALWLIVRWEERRWGKRPIRARYFAWLAGAFFAADLVLWHNAIDQVGAGLATVLGNTQVVLVGLIAWLIWRERPQTASLIAIPVVLVGVDPHLGRARAGRLRQESGARRDLRRPDRARVHGLPARAAPGRPRDRRARRARCSTRRSPPRSAARSSASPSATST